MSEVKRIIAIIRTFKATVLYNFGSIDQQNLKSGILCAFGVSDGEYLLTVDSRISAS